MPPYPRSPDPTLGTSPLHGAESTIPERFAAVAAEAFRPAPLAGLAHVVLAAETTVDYADDARRAWAGIADEVEVRLVPGPWIDRQLLQGSGSLALAEALRDILRAEEPERTPAQTEP